jgi:hypothetical protein
MVSASAAPEPLRRPAIVRALTRFSRRSIAERDGAVRPAVAQRRVISRWSCALRGACRTRNTSSIAASMMSTTRAGNLGRPAFQPPTPVTTACAVSPIAYRSSSRYTVAGWTFSRFAVASTSARVRWGFSSSGRSSRWRATARSQRRVSPACCSSSAFATGVHPYWVDPSKAPTIRFRLCEQRRRRIDFDQSSWVNSASRNELERSGCGNSAG